MSNKFNHTDPPKQRRHSYLTEISVVKVSSSTQTVLWKDAAKRSYVLTHIAQTDTSQPI